MGDIINQVLDALKNRPTLILDEPLAKAFDVPKGGVVIPQLLPPRGTGLKTGRAGERRAGDRRGFLDRMKRHYG